VLAVAALMLSYSCAAVGPALPVVVQSRSIQAAPLLADYLVTVHILLQVHENPDERMRARQDPARLAACREFVVSTALAIAKTGVPAIVVEGVYANGAPDRPEPVPATNIPKTDPPSAKWLLASHPELTVYGFELRPLNEFGMFVVNQFGRSIAQADELTSGGSGDSISQKPDEYRRKVQEDFTRLNLWYAGVVPERSFLALQTALAVALERHENQVQLIIGKQHWGDLVYAANRHKDVRLRLVPYPCD